jgi:hypothetical protein
VDSRPLIPQCGTFTRELEQLHPDNRHVRDNPVNNTGQEFANNCKCYATSVCCFISVMANGNCRDPQLSTFNQQLFCDLWRLP